MNHCKIALIGAGNRWTHAYAEWIKEHSDHIELIAIAELNKERLDFHRERFNLPQEVCFHDWKQMLEYIKDKDVQAVVICTSDHDHYEPAIACLKQKYHLLLEKPIAPTPKECIAIAQVANENNRVVMVAHVLRYTPFFTKIKDLIPSIGKVQAIQHTENIGYFHMAHSFVRGIWNKKEESNPIIMSKSCHDLDILLFILGDQAKVKNVAAFGTLNHFNKSNAPKGAPERCSKVCPVYETCPYSIKTYLTTGAFATSIDGGINHGDKLEEVLASSRYGRCVYYCDNDVCDSMSNILEFDDGASATFTLSAFTDEVDRTISIMGSHGQIRGCMERDEVIFYRFGSGEGRFRNRDTTVYNPLENHREQLQGFAGHGGGDGIFLQDFINAINGEGKALTSINQSIQSHLIAFALEKSRISKQIINMEEFKQSV
ncbi:MAG: Gfo/Idh/MocA family protein [Brevinema sp.]